MIEVVSGRKIYCAMLFIQKSYQNIQHEHAQTKSYIWENIWQDYIVVTRQRTRNLQVMLWLMIKMKLHWKAIVQVLEMLQQILLDSCSQRTFVTDNLLKKLGLSGVRTSINIKTLSRSKKVTSSLIEGLMVSKQPLFKDKRFQ